MNTTDTTSTIAGFIDDCKRMSANERANCQPFLIRLCDVLNLEAPAGAVADVTKNAYVFERDVTFHNNDGTTSTGRIDLYKRGCFVLEAKQGSEQLTDEQREDAALVGAKKKKKGTAVRGTKGWDDAMVKAKGQAEQYAKALPPEEGWPPFLIVVDVGHTIELFADFARMGKNYLPFPDPGTYRIRIDQLADDEIQKRLRAVWTDPLSLDPSRISAKATRDLAERLAKLAKSLEGTKDAHGETLTPDRVAKFLMRCLFTMFAEDVELLPRDSFKDLLKSLTSDIATLPHMLNSLWESMNVGSFSPILRTKLRHFNGGLFEDCEALPLRDAQLELLIEASEANWREVEPAIFGTLLERALDPIERHKLGAHYTPRAYVERLVLPTIVEPLRDEWDAVKAAAVTLANRGEQVEARETVRAFHVKLCETNILDPACGTGNFLYVAMEHMKRLEGEVLNLLLDLGERQTEIVTVDPHQFHGIEVNPRAAAIADLVLWIGYLQWHIRTRELKNIREPIIQKYRNIECRDAVLAWDAMEKVRDEHGKPVTRWDGRTMKKHPVTGEDVPDETARVSVFKYINPRKAAWPPADYVVGNPPFVGDKVMKTAFGSGYVEALRRTYDSTGSSCDFVMYWWHNAAERVCEGEVQRFGFIATNSLRQNFNRRVIEPFLHGERLSLRFAIPDHPWVDSVDGAAVRISMTVASIGRDVGSLLTIYEEDSKSDPPTLTLRKQDGFISSDLTLGADLTVARDLKANEGLSCPGVKLFGQGFVIEDEEANKLRRGDGLAESPLIRPYITARELTQAPRERYVIDLLGISETEVRTKFPTLFQLVRDRVKSERDTNNRESYRRNWWIFGEPRRTFRNALVGLSRQIVTPETSKHRFFTFLPIESIAEGTLIVIASDDAWLFGVLSSRVHEKWALAAGSRLGVGNDPRYNKSRCFDPFPFPACTDVQKQKIRELGEQLDAHRKRQQAAHPSLTMTGMYNVLEKLRSGESLSAKEQTIHEQGLVSVLKQIHDELAAAVFEAYGWPASLTDEEILERLVALNAERAAEESRGLVRWLRPEFQNPPTQKQQVLALDGDRDAGSEDRRGKGKRKGGKPEKPPAAKPAKKSPWPKSLPEQVQAIRQQLLGAAQPVTAGELAKQFLRGNSERIDEVLQSLVITGNARVLDGERYVAA